tara:strand:+ start:477 stop:1361 length:885 start_codon:yes stop_codon:yes gene_type:complete
MREAFITKNFQKRSQAIICLANEIIEEYQEQGFDLTLRQLYYQFVARDYIENSQRSYKNLGSIINDARLAGLIDWSAIEDRTRNLDSKWHFLSPRDAIEQMRRQYVIDMWENQPNRIEVWIEKEALVGVISRVCRKNDVPFMACRGFVSQSEMYAAGKRAEKRFLVDGQETIIIHLGDHDPSGMDMTRDNEDRLSLFAGYDSRPDVIRIALNMDQVDHFNPPPNPAKLTDSRAKDYIARYGRQSWELDALDPKVITTLIEKTVHHHRDPDLWNEKVIQHEEECDTLDKIIEELD